MPTLAPWKKSYDHPRQHFKKQGHYFANKVPSSQSYGFSGSHVWSWVPKNWCFWTVVLEKTLESLLDSRRSNQSILKEISQEYSLEGLMRKLKLQYFGHLSGQRTDSFEKTLILGKIEGRRRRGRQRMRWLDGITDWMDMSLSKLREVGDGQGGLACCSPWGLKELDPNEWLNWTELILSLFDLPPISTPQVYHRVQSWASCAL